MDPYRNLRLDRRYVCLIDRSLRISVLCLVKDLIRVVYIKSGL